MKKIPLTQGKHALVDDEDYDFLNQFKWCARKDNKSGSFYAERGLFQGPDAKPKIKCIKMHRIIVGELDSKVHIDHADGNTLNNTRGNLRKSSPLQNGGNRLRLNHRNSSGFRGVSRSRNRTNPWIAQINKNGKRTCIGYYPTPEEAARAFDKAAKEIYGEFCGKLNFD